MLSAALNQQGLALLTGRQFVTAAEFFREAIALKPEFADARTNLGVALFMQGKFKDSLIALKEADRLRPDHGETALNIAYAMWKTASAADAVAPFLRAIELTDHTQAHVALGCIYWELGAHGKAIYHSQVALKREPDNIMANETLREVYHHKGEVKYALLMCDRLVDLVPHDPNHVLKRALVKLTYDPDDWEEHERRYESSEENIAQWIRSDPKFFSRMHGKLWEGQRTGRLVIVREQGFGDVIQFLRFIPAAASRCDKLLVYIPPGLNELARRSFGHIENVEICEDFPDHFDHYCLIMSLPRIMGRVSNDPYIIAPGDRYPQVREIKKFKIGLSWAGNPKHPEDRFRSIPFEEIRKLLDVDVQFVSLQVGAKDNLVGLPIMTPLPKPVHFAGVATGSWTETASLIDALDLVICADTAVTHMAGAMGKPVWLMNRYNTDWRWGLEKSWSHWYPSMTIFRQERMGDWSSVIEQVKQELIHGNR